MLPLPILVHLATTFNLTHLYISSPVTCPTNIYKYYFPFTRDIIFGSYGTSFQYKWRGSGFAHPHNDQETQQAIHWARLAAHADPDNITILITTGKLWYQNQTPLASPFSNTHLLAHFPPDTITFDEVTILPFRTIEPSTKLNTFNIYCIHNIQTLITCHDQLTSFANLLRILYILHTYLQIIPPTPPDIHVNTNKNWNSATYPLQLICPQTPPLLPDYHTNLPPKFPPLYSYYTDGSFDHPNKKKI
jgi:hypothetical protein